MSMEKLPIELISALLDKGLSYTDIAQKIGVWSGTPSRWLRDIQYPTKANYIKLRKLYDDYYGRPIRMNWVWTWFGISKREPIEIPRETWREGIGAIADWITNYFGEKWASAQQFSQIKAGKPPRIIGSLVNDFYAHHRVGFERELRAALKKGYEQKARLRSG